MFIGWSRVKGVTGTIRLIKKMAHFLPPVKPGAEEISEEITFLHKRFPFLFLAKDQKCLIRGFLLFFYGKRMGLNMRLRFGCCWDDDKDDMKVHCWILLENKYFYEIAEVIDEYELLVEYS